MWVLDCEESWVPKSWWFWTVVLEKTLESHLDCKEVQPVHPKGDQSLVFIGRTDVEAETPILGPPHGKSWLIGKDPMLGWMGAGGEGDNRGWDGWMASPTLWTRVWVDSGSWWWTGRPGMLQFIGSQWVGHNWATELNWTSREGIQLHPSTENRIKHLLSMAPPIRLRPSFSLSQCLPPCLPPGNFHKPLTILHQRVDRLKTTITEN